MVGFGPPSGRRTRREWWRRQIERRRQSTHSVTQFCSRLGVPVRSAAGIAHLLCRQRRVARVYRHAPRPRRRHQRDGARGAADGKCWSQTCSVSSATTGSPPQGADADGNSDRVRRPRPQPDGLHDPGPVGSEGSGGGGDDDAIVGGTSSSSTSSSSSATVSTASESGSGTEAVSAANSSSTAAASASSAASGSSGGSSGSSGSSTDGASSVVYAAAGGSSSDANGQNSDVTVAAPDVEPDDEPAAQGSNLAPQPGGYAGGRWNPMNWRRWLMTGDASAPDGYYQAADEAAGAYVDKRIAPTIQTVGGVMEVGTGAAMAATGVGAVPGAVLIAHGADTAVAGARGMYSGETKQTLTKQAVTAATGSEMAGTVADVAIPLVAGIGGGIAVARGQAAKKAAQKVAAAEAEAAAEATARTPAQIEAEGYGIAAERPTAPAPPASERTPLPSAAPKAAKPAFIGNASTPGQAFKNLVSEIATNLKGASQAERIQAFRDGLAAIRQHVGDFTVDAEFLASDLGGGALDYAVFVGGPGPKGTPIVVFGKNGVYTGSLEASIGRTPSGQPVFNPFRANLEENESGDGRHTVSQCGQSGRLHRIRNRSSRSLTYATGVRRISPGKVYA